MILAGRKDRRIPSGKSSNVAVMFDAKPLQQLSDTLILNYPVIIFVSTV